MLCTPSKLPVATTHSMEHARAAQNERDVLVFYVLRDLECFADDVKHRHQHQQLGPDIFHYAVHQFHKGTPPRFWICGAGKI